MQHHQQIGLPDCLPRPRYANFLNWINGFPQPSGVDHMHRNAFHTDALAYGVARGAGYLGDDGDLLASQTVKEARLAHVRPSYQDHAYALPQEAALLRR